MYIHQLQGIVLYHRVILQLCIQDSTYQFYLYMLYFLILFLELCKIYFKYMCKVVCKLEFSSPSSIIFSGLRSACNTPHSSARNSPYKMSNIHFLISRTPIPTYRLSLNTSSKLYDRMGNTKHICFICTN